ncbi:hypothetical protein BCR36DRAFT_347027 [Piromyces finnis]|uniref:Uncharacterized protein n=1 Tax=Piromyces finnis TaxID=1754191 RepID=A0A1Y1VFY5_9FUNG|nr:hypothetical protein BCR36DRAFT_347027 [Piromyces finnis]|eukprot:ORX55318.1 hypothetical protein BCR36DRAFT_347027 [Piromyces finnis]
MENLNRTVSEKLNLTKVNDIVNEKVKSFNDVASVKLDALNGKINGMNLSFNGKVNEEKVKSVTGKTVDYLKIGLQYLQNLIQKFSAFVLSAPVFGILAAVFAIPLFICLVIFLVLSPILVPWFLVVLTIAIITFLIAASFFLLKVFLTVTIITIVVKTVMKLTDSKNKARGSEKITVDKVISTLTESAKEYVELCKTYYGKTVEYSKTGYTKSVTTVKSLIEKRKGAAAPVESKPEETQPLVDDKAENDAEEKQEEEKKNE